MLEHVDVGPRSLGPYGFIVGEETVEAITELAEPLRGARIAHINSTTYGAGVCELLRSIVPLYRGLGIQADWKLISTDPQFFRVTKAFRNALQGAPYELEQAARETYLTYNSRNAELLEEEYDFIIVHDPQAAAIRHFRGAAGAKWIWRCHIDTSEPNEAVLEFMLPFLAEYDALIFTMEGFVPAALKHQRVVTMTPAIDPLSPKNMGLPARHMPGDPSLAGHGPAAAPGDPGVPLRPLEGPSGRDSRSTGWCARRCRVSSLPSSGPWPLMTPRCRRCTAGSSPRRGATTTSTC